MIAFDTGILIYGVQAAKRQQRPLNDREKLEYIPRATALIDELQRIRSRVLLPMPAAWEYVLDFPIGEQPAVWSSLSWFALQPLDEAAARIAAQLARQHFDEQLRTQKGRGKKALMNDGARQRMKVDLLILGTAIAHRSERIYTTDVEQFRQWSQGRIPVFGLPPDQKRLFNPAEPP